MKTSEEQTHVHHRNFRGQRSRPSHRADAATEVTNDNAKEVVAAAEEHSPTAVKAEATPALGENLTVDGFDARTAMGLFPNSTVNRDAEGDLRAYVAQFDAPATAPQQPGFLQSVGDWVADTAKGYVTGAVLSDN